MVNGHIWHIFFRFGSPIIIPKYFIFVVSQRTLFYFIIYKSKSYRKFTHTRAIQTSDSVSSYLASCQPSLFIHFVLWGFSLHEVDLVFHILKVFLVFPCADVISIHSGVCNFKARRLTPFAFDFIFIVFLVFLLRKRREAKSKNWQIRQQIEGSAFKNILARLFLGPNVFQPSSLAAIYQTRKLGEGGEVLIPPPLAEFGNFIHLELMGVPRCLREESQRHPPFMFQL